MDRIEIHGLYGKSTVLVGETIENVGKYLPNTKIFIIADENVKAYHGVKFPQAPTYCVEPGEKSKSLEVAGELYYWLLEMGADRNSFILGIGGGVVCDLAGFVASTFMRGLDFGFVATSLLAQVDASVGGKNGINISGFKNIVGTFTQPKFVICDINLLKTLPQEEFLNGFAEIVKHTIIADAKMFSFIEESIEELKAFNTTIIEQLVSHSVNIKAKIVQADEREKGERKKLNLGHTWGHAIEKETGFSHGKSVSLGLEFASKLSVSKGYLKNRDYMRLMYVLKNLELPVCVTINNARVFEVLKKDKKKTVDSIDFILMKGIGEVVIERISLEEIKSLIEPSQ